MDHRVGQLGFNPECIIGLVTWASTQDPRHTKKVDWAGEQSEKYNIEGRVRMKKERGKEERKGGRRRLYRNWGAVWGPRSDLENNSLFGVHCAARLAAGSLILGVEVLCAWSWSSGVQRGGGAAQQHHGTLPKMRYLHWVFYILNVPRRDSLNTSTSENKQ